jgi:hypothetical protein
MRCFIQKILLFTFILSITYLILVIFWGEFVPNYLRTNLIYKYNSYGHLNSRLHDVEGYANVDILFIGSSRSYRHYDTRIFADAGYYSFNLGSSSQTLLQTEILLKRYLDKLNPKFIIIDVYPGMITSDGIESSIDLLSNSKFNIQTLDLFWKQKNIKVLNTAIFSVYKQIFYKRPKDNEKKIRGTDSYIPGGYVEKKYQGISEYPIERLKVEPRDNQLKALKEIVKILKIKNIDYVFVQSPNNAKMIYYDYDKFDQIFKTENYLNYSAIKIIDDELHFFDQMHMNQLGTKIYDEYMLKNVINKYFK